MSPLLRSMLAQGVAWPLIATFSLLGLVALLARAGLPERAALALRAAAIASGFLVALRLIHGPLVFPPGDAVGWLVWLVAAAWALFAIDDIAAFPRALRWALQLGLVGLACGLLVGGVLRRDLAGNAWSVGCGVLVWCAAWGYLDRRREPRFSVLALVLVAAGNAIVSAATGSVLLGQLSGALAVTLGAWLLWQGWRPGARLGHAAAAVGSVALGSLMLIGRVFAETPVWLELLLVGAIGLDAVAILVARRRAAPGGAKWIAAQAGLMIAPVAIAVGMTLWIYLRRAAGS